MQTETREIGKKEKKERKLSCNAALMLQVKEKSGCWIFGRKRRKKKKEKRYKLISLLVLSSFSDSQPSQNSLRIDSHQTRRAIAPRSGNSRDCSSKRFGPRFGGFRIGLDTNSGLTTSCKILASVIPFDRVHPATDIQSLGLSHLSQIPDLNISPALQSNRQPEPVFREVHRGNSATELEIRTNNSGADVINKSGIPGPSREQVPIGMEISSGDFYGEVRIVCASKCIINSIGHKTYHLPRKPE